MRIVENTRERLVLDHRRVIRPYITGFLALLFAVMGYFAWSDAPGITYGFLLISGMWVLALFVFDLPRSQAVFSRRDGTVTIRHTLLGRGKPEIIRLGSIRYCYAEIAGANSMVTGSTMTGGQKRPQLALGNNSSVPLTKISNFSKSQELAVEAVNTWLGRKKP